MRPLHTPPPRYLPWLYAVAAALAVFLYFFDLGGQHIPKNGDEFPYAHITRLTAASGQWLPLQSELDGMRNTKPPLLFWQGIASTGGGAQWSLWHLRYPSVLYTLATALLCFLLATRLSRSPAKGMFAALSFLAFFTTYRFGRPFLTNAPETFWLFLPFFLLLHAPRAFDSRRLPLAIGVIVGMGLLYKSFALLLPVGLTLAAWYLRERGYRLRDFFAADFWKLATIAVLALGLFSLWFALDPEPQAIWQEFVVKENAGKLDAHGGGYFAKLLWGTSSVWTLLLGFPMNAGLLAFPVIGLAFSAVRRPHQVSREERLLWIALIVTALVFSLPSQRSARYLLDVMPAFAVLCALASERIGRAWFLVSLLCTALLVGLLAYLAGSIHAAHPEANLFGAGYAALLAATLVFVLLAFIRPALTRPGSVVAALLGLLALGAFLAPFNGPAGRYDAATQSRLAGREIAVPYDFNAKFEAYTFLLPKSTLLPYAETRETSVDELAQRYPLFAAHQPLDAPPCSGCTPLATRIDLRGRHSPVELQEIFRGRVFENLFIKEVIYATGTPPP